MNKRFSFKEADPGIYKAMMAMENYVAAVKDVSPLHKELIRIRASQINGCSYCIAEHAADARKLGETEQRIYLLSVWREVPQFTEEEKIILALVDEVTLIHREGLTDATYEKALAAFGAPKTAAIVMMIITINAWNRLGISGRKVPE
jgi:AhpD family alkylhydroperoxidase